MWVAIIVTQRYNQVTFSNHNIHFIGLGVLPLPRRWTLPPNVQLRGSKGESEIYAPILFWAELSSRLTLHGTTINLDH